jgi:hypothetical protein
VCKLYGIALPLLGGHKTVELHNHKNQRLLEMIQIETNTVSLTLAKQHMFLEERDIYVN